MTAPRIAYARNYPYPSTIEVYFTIRMKNNVALVDPTSYSLDLGAYVTSVTVFDDYEAVRLTTENLFGHPEFVLSISGELQAEDNTPFDTSSTATIKLAAAEEGIYALSAANGRLKSGQMVKKVTQDVDYFYVLTESGLDVVDKTSLFNKGYVLRSSGFNTITIGGE